MTEDQKHISFFNLRNRTFLALLFVILGFTSWVYTKQIQDKDLKNVLSNKMKSADKEMLKALQSIPDKEPDENINKFIQHRRYKDLAIFVYDRSKLIAWNNHSISNLKLLENFESDLDLVRLDNGYYLVKHLARDNLKLFALKLVKHDFNYENDYLRNEYNREFNIYGNPPLLLEPEAGCQRISVGDKTLFFIGEDETKVDKSFWSYLSLVFFILAFVLIFVVIANQLINKFNSPLFIIAYLAILLGFRIIFIQCQKIFEFDNLSLFDPQVYASSIWFPSLGDFTITGIFLFAGCLFMWKWIIAKSKNMSQRQLLFSFTGYLVLFFLFAFWINILFRGLVEDSNIAFNINNFFQLSPYSLIGILAIGILLFGIYYLALALSHLWRCLTSLNSKLILLLSFSAIYIIVLHSVNIVDGIMILWSIVLLLFTLCIPDDKKNQLSPTIVLITILTIYASYMYEKYTEISEEKKLKILAENLSINNDQIAEILFVDVDKNMQEGDRLLEVVKEANISKNHLGHEIEKEFFRGYWDKYEVSAFLFDSLGNSISGNTVPERRTKEMLDKSISEASYSTTEGLFMVDPSERHLCYLLNIPIKDKARDFNHELYIELEYKFIAEDLGFPELLIKGSSINREYSSYSVARFYDNTLITESGSYPYLIEKNKEIDKVTNEVYHKDEFMHFAIEKAPYTFIVSRPVDSLLNKLTDFTYLYSIFGLLFLVLIILQKAEKENIRRLFSLQIKIQTLVISIVLISLMLFGLGSYYYIVSQNQSKNENLLREKVASVLIELSHKLEKEKAMDNDKKIAEYLIKFSNVFFTDINIYSLDGHLRASSRPQLFENGIISTRMHPDAYKSLVIDKNSRYTHTEEIGRLDYLSSYVPFYGPDYEVLAYLNLPYFAKQAELEQELSAFVVAIINMLVLMFILSAFGALFVSRLITNPLKVIEKNLSGISLEKTNKPIRYKGKDEIATLVNAYNDKLYELKVKAEELAKSERETAWREMAKQVAHEIKNPLTPMKLSIQYLQRAWQDKSEDWEDRFDRSTTTLIEQIDTLSSIATAFGDFAKMPTAQAQKIDLKLILEQVIELFAENIGGSEINFTNNLAGPQYIIADKDQMTRVFNNLIKNALQSIPENQEGNIQVSLINKGFQYIVEIKDNGIGISPEQREKIFVPNFTTKSTGTGLGLAMVKSIVESVDGKVWFNSKEKVGTSFFVSLNAAKTD